MASETSTWNTKADLVPLEKGKEKELRTRISKIKQAEVLRPGVVYVGHVPHGFFEPQVKRFFSQFGTVSRVRLARSKKTGGSKGYGYIEFECEEVAKVVAETMNNYLMFEKLLKCEFIPVERLHPKTFNGWNRKFHKPTRRSTAIRKHNKPKDAAATLQSAVRLAAKDQGRKRRYAALGIKYDFSGYDDIAKKAKLQAAGTVSPKVPKSGQAKKPEQSPVTLMLDSSDPEITFKTPPGVAKVKKVKKAGKKQT
ncbi:PREDICTED: MKI67 FHA domain-interacting nucleolar phosphoprotein-like [Branchiostoma belcheri]|uniref:MKI67 FHA domain-interacting nucleolar phosphoprotein-like n=1 Tax=Branchiostoma belcheri TaxID=7741 RepID=A0A6P4ZED2_BRABE|nr:PREDICTED: MKI67 FHA domain-interacting nucleolar phosphoprotein-like [Branchiostoma belcheri]